MKRLVEIIAEEQNETFHRYITDCPRLRQFRTDNTGHFDSNTWKTAELLNFSYIPEINDYLERIDYLVYGNLLAHNYLLDDSSWRCPLGSRCLTACSLGVNCGSTGS